MLKDLLSALFLARKMFNSAKSNSTYEHNCWTLMYVAESAVYNKVGYEKGRVYVLHIEYIADGVQWDYYKDISALNMNINFKAGTF